MNYTVRDALRVLREFAPEEWAEEWDNVGLQFGREDAPLRRAMTCLDVTEETVEAARQAQADLIVAHHPMLFRPPKTLREDRAEGRLIAALIRADLAFYAAHTNVDVAPGGTNDVLADALGVTATRPLLPGPKQRQYKLAVFTPPEAVPAVIEAAARAGAGVIGNYSHCTFRAPGTGTYLPWEGANPYAGEIGRLEEAREDRLEVIVPERRLAATLEAVRAAHPYEEMAYDLYPLENPGPPLGLGRIGTLSEAMSLDAFAAHVCDRLDAGYVDVTRGNDPVRRVAVCGGSCGKFIEAAHGAGADVFVTSEIGHHQKLLARSLGLSLVEASHAATERPVVPAMARVLREALPGLEVLERTD
ncbi:MAG: Nif3-like dinuclear metal center hexameric protein [Armatimonadetes bacterium]|nr:Nif3-like dinuclear metal center hexameric protein [Armatimonadota bacterium]